jgi:putative acetyltransferase
MATDASELANVVLQARAASRRLLRELDIIKGKVGLAGVSYTQGHVLLQLESRGLMTVAELAEVLSLDKSTLSRAVAQLVNGGYLESRENDADKRQKPVALTPRGRALVARIHRVVNADVEAALSPLSSEERESIIDGMHLYARALHRSRMQRRYKIRRLRESDNEYISRVIHRVMTEFELDRPGTSLSDEEVKAMYEAYNHHRAAYFVVVTDNDRVVGGAGIGPLIGGEDDVCELKKMYILPEARGIGIGEQLLQLCLDAAREAGYQTCYLETIRQMTAARALYAKYGFEPLVAPIGNTGHFGCDSWFARRL